MVIFSKKNGDSLETALEARDQANERVREADKELTALRDKLEAAQARAAATQLVMEEHKALSQGIRQGVKSTVQTVPLPVRLEVGQIRMLKILSALEGTTASAIIRKCIAEHLEQKLVENPTFSNAVLPVDEK